MKITVGNFQDVPERAGLADGGHVYLDCSSCGRRLVDVCLTKEDPSLRWRGKAECCYCGDSSFPAEWSGHFAPGGHSVPADDPGAEGPDSFRSVTAVTGIEPRGDTLVFRTKKVG